MDWFNCSKVLKQMNAKKSVLKLMDCLCVPKMCWRKQRLLEVFPTLNQLS
jgi:hypothetical protein